MSNSTSSVTTDRQVSWVTWPAMCAVAVAVTLIALRYGLAQDRAFAGPSDMSFYFTLAKKIFTGNGLSIDYLWHFLQPWNAITHPANDFWLPSTALFIAGGFWLTGATNLHSALIMPGVAWLLIGVTVFVLMRRLSLNVAESVWAAILALSTPFLLERSLLTDSAIFASLFGTIAIILSALIVRDLRWCPLAFASMAITYVIRQDGILLSSGIAVAVLANRAPVRSRAMWVAAGACTFAACCAPMWMINEWTIGSLMPTAPIKAAFFTRHEDLYAYDKALTLSTYLAGGLSSIALSKLKMFYVEYSQLPQLLGWALLLSVVILAALTRRSVHALPWPFRVAAVVMTAQFAFYALVATFPGGTGGFARAFASIIPSVAAAVTYALASIVRNQSVRLSILAAIAGLNLIAAVPALQHRFQTMDAKAREFELAGHWLRQRQAQGDVTPIVMTREPWEFSELTDLPSVQIPSDGLNAICRAARRFNASFILVPALERPEIEQALRAGDRRFSRLARISGTSFSFLRIESRCTAQG